MLRTLCLTTGLLASLALAGCATTTPNGGGSTTISIPSIDPAVIAQVQQTAVQVCGFLPAVETVAGIITSFAGGAAAVGAITAAADGICKAVTAKSARRGSSPRYRGVRIRGHFVR